MSDPARSLTLYHLSDELAQLTALRVEMAEAGEDTTAVDHSIALYLQALPDKVDAVAHVLHTIESQIALAKVEQDRIAKRTEPFQAAFDRIRQYACDVLAELPKPAKGCRKLDGQSSTLMLKGNGGLAPLQIDDETLVPDECCVAQVQMPYADWMAMWEAIIIRGEKAIDPQFLANAQCQRSVDNKAVRKSLDEPCWACEGKGGECISCGGTGKQGVPGARLMDRGMHLEIR